MRPMRRGLWAERKNFCRLWVLPFDNIADGRYSDGFGGRVWLPIRAVRWGMCSRESRGTRRWNVFPVDLTARLTPLQGVALAFFYNLVVIKVASIW